jgi:hypothetical protein
MVYAIKAAGLAVAIGVGSSFIVLVRVIYNTIAIRDQSTYAPRALCTGFVHMGHFCLW